MLVIRLLPKASAAPATPLAHRNRPGRRCKTSPKLKGRVKGSPKAKSRRLKSSPKSKAKGKAKAKAKPRAEKCSFCGRFAFLQIKLRLRSPDAISEPNPMHLSGGKVMCGG